MQPEQTSDAHQAINGLTEAEPTAITSGAKKIFIGGLSAKGRQTALPDDANAEVAAAVPLADLTPQQDVQAAGSSNQGWGKWEFNHNETIAVDESDEDAETAPLTYPCVKSKRSRQKAVVTDTRL